MLVNIDYDNTPKVGIVVECRVEGLSLGQL